MDEWKAMLFSYLESSVGPSQNTPSLATTILYIQFLLQ